MLAGNLAKRAVKGTVPREPFVDHHTQGILVTGRHRMIFPLFGGQVRNGTSHLLFGFEDFDGSRSFLIHMLPKVDVAAGSISQETDQAIVAKLFSRAVYHQGTSEQCSLS